MQRYDDALASYDKAIGLNPAYAEAHFGRGYTSIVLNNYEQALASLDKAVALEDKNADMHLNRGFALMQLKRHEEALSSFDKAIALKADDGWLHFNRGKVLEALNRPEPALASYDKAIALRYDNADVYSYRGNILHQPLQLHKEALASFDKAIALEPDNPSVCTGRGNLLITMGNMRGAEQMLRKALSIRGDYATALSYLAQIGKYDAQDTKKIEALLSAPDDLSPDEKGQLHFALGKIYDDCGRYDDAFYHYQQANQIIISVMPAAYRKEGFTTHIQNLISVFSKEFLSRPVPFAQSIESPVFVVGMPRSGTTLVSSILSRHPSVDTAGEVGTIPEFPRHIDQMLNNGKRYPQTAESITPLIASTLILKYEKRLRRDVGRSAPHVVDKLPFNFLHLGLIAMLFPKARIIHCIRHPLDTCLSNYFQRFAPNLEYSFDLQTTAHFYGLYTTLMEHWRKVLPIPMLDIQYEDIVLSNKQATRRMLKFLELPWDERLPVPSG